MPRSVLSVLLTYSWERMSFHTVFHGPISSSDSSFEYCTATVDFSPAVSEIVTDAQGPSAILARQYRHSSVEEVMGSSASGTSP